MIMDEAIFPIVEIFASLQGEGYNTGMPAVFLRFGKCNLNCPWCDTPFNTYTWVNEEIIISRVISSSTIKSLIVTGGEPLIQIGLEKLLRRFKALGYWLGIESNGLIAPSATLCQQFDYMAISPKAQYANHYINDKMVRHADEVRVVVDGDVRTFCETIRTRIIASHYFLSPCERNGALNVKETISLLGELNQKYLTNKWMLSLQTQKLAHFK